MEGHISSSGKPPTVDLGRFRNRDGDKLCCIICYDRDGKRIVSDPCTTLEHAITFVSAYNSYVRNTGRYAEIRSISGTVKVGRILGLRSVRRKEGAK